LGPKPKVERRKDEPVPYHFTGRTNIVFVKIKNNAD
jgi:hypothetical protein